MEGGILHPQWVEDALTHKPAERLSRHTLDQDPEHIRTMVVQPTLSGLRHPRQRTQLLQPFVHRWRFRRHRRTIPTKAVFTNQFLNRICIWHRNEAAEAHAEC